MLQVFIPVGLGVRQSGVPVQAGVSLAEYSTPVLGALLGSKKLTPPVSPLTDPRERFIRSI